MRKQTPTLSEAWRWLEQRNLGKAAIDCKPTIAVGWEGKSEAIAVFSDGSTCVRFKSGKHIVENTVTIAYGVLKIYGADHLAIRLAHLLHGHLSPATLRKPAFALPPECVMIRASDS
jgi:hypothetical protein